MLTAPRAAQYGLQPGEITETLETALNGRKVSEAIEGARRYDVVVRFDDASRNSLDALQNVTIDTPQGTQIPVSAVANIENLPGPNQILRENTKRRIVISSNTGGRDLGSVVRDMQRESPRRLICRKVIFSNSADNFRLRRKRRERFLCFRSSRLSPFSFC